MSDLPLTTDETASSVNRTGVYFAVLQLVFTLGWTTYLIYLPMLAAQVGIAPSAVILILMLDQAIFTIADTAMGIAADRIAPVVGRLGAFVGVLTALSRFCRRSRCSATAWRAPYRLISAWCCVTTTRDCPS
jgi:MFS family permease